MMHLPTLTRIELNSPGCDPERGRKPQPVETAVNIHTENAPERGVDCIKPDIHSSSPRQWDVIHGENAPPVPSLAVTKIMVSLLEPKPDEILMEIGTGTGSQTLVWQRYFKEVHSVELNEKWHIAENQPLGPHVYLSYGDGAKGLPDVAPFDAIVATCGVPDIPPAWVDQLTDSGRLVAPVGTNQCQKLTLFRKLGNHLIPVKVAAYTRFVMMEKEKHGNK